METADSSGESESSSHGPTEDEAHEEHLRTLWPFIGAVGVGSLYIGVALLFIDVNTDLVPSWLGPLFVAGGATGFVAGLGGWLYSAFIADYWTQRVTRGRRLYVATMILFLISDVATFGALFVYYIFIRVGSWPPKVLPSGLLSVILGINTAALIVSSFTLHYGHRALERGNRRRFVVLLGTTLLLGIVFVGGQVIEYFGFITEEGFTMTAGIFGTAFFGLTGLHGIHVSLGVILLSVLFYRALRGQYSDSRDTSIATVSLYWHFVDLVWIILVTVLYVGASIGAKP